MTPATPGHFSEYSQSLFDADEAVLPVSGKLPSYIRDHRKRLRERFITGGALAMPDYELLELVLFRAVPRCDMKPLARRLLETFGDFNRVLSAPKERLAEVQGVGSAVVQELKIVEAASHRLARARDANRRHCHWIIVTPLWHTGKQNNFASYSWTAKMFSSQIRNRPAVLLITSLFIRAKLSSERWN